MREASSRALLAAGFVLAANLSWAQQNIDGGAILTLSAQAAGQVASTDQSNTTSSALKCVANLTAVSGGTVQLAIQGRDRGSGQYVNILATPGILGAGVYTLTVGRAVTAGLLAGPWVTNDVLPATWRVIATVLGSSSTSVTGTVGCSLIN